jgi:speckle-type POZ protein
MSAGLGRLSRSATRVVAQAANGFHLLRIDGYSQTKMLLPGQKLSSHPFNVGGHCWRMDCYPNGRYASSNSDAMSLYLQLTSHHKQFLQVQARYKFSLLDHAGNAPYELPAEIATFATVDEGPQSHLQTTTTITYGADEEPGTGCGHEVFIAQEELERREHLIRDDTIVVRCDVSVTEVDKSWLALDDLNGCREDGEEWEEDGYEEPPPPPPPQRRPRRRADDGEYVNWCMAQRADGARR